MPNESFDSGLMPQVIRMGAKEETNQEAGVVLAACLSDKTLLGTERRTSKHADKRTVPDESLQFWVEATGYQHEAPKRKLIMKLVWF